MLIINSLCSATTDHSSLLHLARFHHSIIWQKGNTSKRISIGGVPVLHSWMFFFFLWLNPYLHHSPSGPLVPDATARLFSGWAIWAALYWRSIESKYSAFLVGLLFFLMCCLPKLEHTFKRMAQINGKPPFGQSACTPLSWKREDSVMQRVWSCIAGNYF